MGMSDFKEYNVLAGGFDPIIGIGGKWALLTAQKPDGRINTMTVSYGFTGVLWHKPAAIVFVRPQRYTNEFIKENDRMSLSFFDGYKDALTLCGRKSGRDCDKISEAGLHPVKVGGGIGFEEANRVFILKKMYISSFEKEKFLSPSALAEYPSGDFHDVYICEIEQAFIKEESGNEL